MVIQSVPLCRLVWNLVHSRWRTDMERGQGLAHILMTSPDLDDQPKRDLVYLIAVADYKLGNILQARKQLRALLEVKVPTTDNIVWGNQGMIW